MLTAEFLCETGPRVGLGHLRRGLVLAKELRAARVACRFSVTDRKSCALVEEDCFPVRVAVVAQPDVPGADILVADGHAIDFVTPLGWRERFGCRVVVDDLGERAPEAEIIVNHNLYAKAIDYRSCAPARLLLGPRYALIDPMFRAIAADSKSAFPTKVLISFGGTDDGIRAEAVARRLLDAMAVEVEIVVSPLLPPAPSLIQFAAENEEHVRIHHGASLVELLRRCTLYVGAMGVTMLEVAASDTPMVVCSIIANQDRNVAALRARGVTAFGTFDPHRLAAAAAAQLVSRRPNPLSGVVDGEGAVRVAEAIFALVGGAKDTVVSTAPLAMRSEQ